MPHFPFPSHSCSLRTLGATAKVIGLHQWKESKNIGYCTLREAKVTVNDLPSDVDLFSPGTEAFIAILYHNIHKKLATMRDDNWQKKEAGGGKSDSLEGLWTSQNGGSKILETFDRVGVLKCHEHKTAISERRQQGADEFAAVDDLILEAYREWKGITAWSPQKKKQAAKNRRTAESAAIKDNEIALVDDSDVEDDDLGDLYE